MKDIPVPASDRSAPSDSDVVQMLGDLHVGSVPMTPEMHNYREAMQKIHKGVKYQQIGGEKPGESDARLGSSPGQEPHNPGQSQQPPFTTPQQPQQAAKQQPPTNSTFASSSTPSSMGAEATPSLIELQQSGIGGLGELAWDMSDFDQSFLRQDPGDLNFERDFGQWFNPGGDVTSDMK